MTAIESWADGMNRILAIACACGATDDLYQNSITGTWACGDCRDDAAYDTKGDR